MTNRSFLPALCSATAMAVVCVALATDAAATPRAAVARIVVAEQHGVAFGSGALVDARGEYGLVVTNWHVVRDATGPVEVVFPDGFRSEARTIKLDEDWDLAALVIWRPPAAPIPIASLPPRPGELLTICGYGAGDYREATGRCTEYYAPEVGLPHELVELSVEARQGDSGGPILNERGEIAGVLFGAGQGTTLGSFGGRVGVFLASVAPGINAPSHSPLAIEEGTRIAAAPTMQPIRTVSPEPAEPDSTEWRTDLSFASARTPPQAVSADLFPAADSPVVLGDRYSAKVSPAAETAVAAAAPEAPLIAEQPIDAQPPTQGPVVASMPTEDEYLSAPLWIDHAKTIFALIGVVFVGLQLIRLAT